VKHGFSFEHVARRPATASMSSHRQRRTKSSSSSAGVSDGRSASFRGGLSSLRNALFNGGGSSRQRQPAVDVKTPAVQQSSSGVFRSLFTRQVRNTGSPSGCRTNNLTNKNLMLVLLSRPLAKLNGLLRIVRPVWLSITDVLWLNGRSYWKTFYTHN